MPRHSASSAIADTDRREFCRSRPSQKKRADASTCHGWLDASRSSRTLGIADSRAAGPRATEGCRYRRGAGLEQRGSSVEVTVVGTLMIGPARTSRDGPNATRVAGRDRRRGGRSRAMRENAGLGVPTWALRWRGVLVVVLVRWRCPRRHSAGEERARRCPRVRFPAHVGTPRSSELGVVSSGGPRSTAITRAVRTPVTDPRGGPVEGEPRERNREEDLEEAGTSF